MSVFREQTTPETTASETPVVPTTPDVLAHTEVETPLIYEEKQGKPYIAKYFEAESVWDKLDHDTQSNAELISEQFKKQVDKGEIRSDSVAYRDFIRKYEKLTNSQDMPFPTKVKKISEFIRYMQRTA